MLVLFLPEAREWLDQIETALQALEAAPAFQQVPTLLQVIRSALTNLGGSAATVNLPSVEELAFAMLPKLQALDRQSRAPSAAQCAALRASLTPVKIALARLAQNPQTAPAPEQVVKSSAADMAASASPDATRNRGLLAALRDLRESRAECSPQAREALDVLVQALRGEGTQDAFADDAKAILRCLDGLTALDEVLTVEAKEQLPGIAGALSGLKAGAAIPGDLKGILQAIAHLRQTAHASGAVPIVRLLQGLERFLTIADRYHSSIPSDRFVAVEEQFNLVLPMVHRWTALGRAKRAAVEQALLIRPPQPRHDHKGLTPV